MRKIAEALAAYIDYLVGLGPTCPDDQQLTPADRAQLEVLLSIADQLKRVLTPVAPRPDFESRLRESLLAAAVQRSTLSGRNGRAPGLVRRRWVLIGAAAGSLLSMAGIITAVILRQRSVARL
jgi:hypothetical protein